MQLFSRMVIGVRARPVRRRPVHTVKEATHAVSATPSVQPALRLTYTLVKARKKPSTIPMRAARTVSCGASPRKARAYHSRSSMAATSSGGMSSGWLRSSSSGELGGLWKNAMGYECRSRMPPTLASQCCPSNVSTRKRDAAPSSKQSALTSQSFGCDRGR